MTSGAEIRLYHLQKAFELYISANHHFACMVNAVDRPDIQEYHKTEYREMRETYLSYCKDFEIQPKETDENILFIWQFGEI